MIIKDEFDFISHEIDFGFFLLKGTYEILFSALPSMKKQAEDKIDKYLEDISDKEEYENESDVQYRYHYMQYEEELPNRLSFSFIMSIYSALEFSLKKLCDDI
jgi:hypothetical protein